MSATSLIIGRLCHRVKEAGDALDVAQFNYNQNQTPQNAAKVTIAMSRARTLISLQHELDQLLAEEVGETLDTVAAISEVVESEPLAHKTSAQRLGAKVLGHMEEAKAEKYASIPKQETMLARTEDHTLRMRYARDIDRTQKEYDALEKLTTELRVIITDHLNGGVS